MKVSVYGAGHVGHSVAEIVRARSGLELFGPYGRTERDDAFTAGADVVVIATTSFLADVGADISAAVRSGANVITSAEEAAFPWSVDAATADDLDRLAREHRVTILGAGLNPGFAFDALVTTLSGVMSRVDALRVERVVELSGFSNTILRRLGLGFTHAEFETGVERGTITGHIGFPQSMRVVADRLGVQLDDIERTITPYLAETDAVGPTMTVPRGLTGGFHQRYVGTVSGRPWFEADFTGHIDLTMIDQQPRDAIELSGPTPLTFVTSPGFNPQAATPAIIANSLERVAAATPGWLTVAQLPPAVSA